MELRLNNKVAMITGASSGIGKAIAELFARAGARVVVTDVDVAGGESVMADILRQGNESTFMKLDVSDASQVKQVVSAASTKYGRIDILCNAAAILFIGTALDTSEAQWNRVLSINLTGTFLCCREVLPHMVRQGGGSIINISSSTGAHDAKGNTVAYVTSKGGVTLLTKALAVDHAEQKVRVNAIAPGPTDTPMLRSVLSPVQLTAFAASFPMKRLGIPEELANVALFLASDASSFVTGAIIAADGGQTADV
jgi:meso-butanediol dehydrogenase / (S,S)-butanediol dehydrogenase / diacetyl reductase